MTQADGASADKSKVTSSQWRTIYRLRNGARTGTLTEAFISALSSALSDEGSSSLSLSGSSSEGIKFQS